MRFGLLSSLLSSEFLTHSMVWSTGTETTSHRTNMRSDLALKSSSKIKDQHRMCILALTIGPTSSKVHLKSSSLIFYKAYFHCQPPNSWGFFWKKKKTESNNILLSSISFQNTCHFLDLILFQFYKETTQKKKEVFYLQANLVNHSLPLPPPTVPQEPNCIECVPVDGGK